MRFAERFGLPLIPSLLAITPKTPFVQLKCRIDIDLVLSSLEFPVELFRIRPRDEHLLHQHFEIILIRLCIPLVRVFVRFARPSFCAS